MHPTATGRTPRTWRSDAAEDVQEFLPLTAGTSPYIWSLSSSITLNTLWVWARR